MSVLCFCIFFNLWKEHHWSITELTIQYGNKKCMCVQCAHFCLFSWDVCWMRIWDIKVCLGFFFNQKLFSWLHFSGIVLRNSVVNTTNSGNLKSAVWLDNESSVCTIFCLVDLQSDIMKNYYLNWNWTSLRLKM